MLTEEQQSTILRAFPNVELSYETITHKNVPTSDFAFAIPEGSKFFAWLTMKDSKPVAIFMEVNSKTKQIINIQMEIVEQDKLSLCKGTIFYGTVFQTNNHSFFCIEDVFYFEGANISYRNMEQKLETVCTVLSKKLVVNYDKCRIFFGIPLIFQTFTKEMNFAIQQLPYKISKIQFYKNEKTRSTMVMNYVYRSFEEKRDFVKQSRDVVFQVKADLQNDIYNLYALNNDLYLHDTAYIQDYTTSVMMNAIFRNIKENVNLDALEESDDEEEFQNDKIDKYVDLNKAYFMTCSFNYKFKKWMPVRIEENATVQAVVKKNDLLRLEKNR